MKKILIVEDESLVAMEIASYLRTLGYGVAGITAYAEEAQTLAAQRRPDAILMDIRLKDGGDGIAAAEQISASLDIPIIFLTAMTDDCNIERAAHLRPAAYLAKPFHRDELRAALKIALMPTKEYSPKTVRIDKSFTYDTLAKKLYRDGQTVLLGTLENRLLQLLLEARGKIVNTYTIENTLWPDKTPNENRRRALVNRLRAKLGNRFIETIPGEGYRFVF